MRMTSCVVWEVERKDIERLPIGFEVLEIDTMHERSIIKYAGQEEMRYQAHYRHYVMKMPPLPVNNLAIQGGEHEKAI